MSNFALAVKSTLDKVVFDLATAKSVQYFDLDSEIFAENMLLTDDSALGWSLVGLTESPMDPLWDIEFDVCGKTTIDPAQYVSLDLISAVNEKFKQGVSFDVKDYSTPTPPTQVLGQILITGLQVRPQHFDKTAGFRTVGVTAKAMRWA